MRAPPPRTRLAAVLFACALAPTLARAQSVPAASTDETIASLRSYAVVGEAVDPFSVPADFKVEDYSLQWATDPIDGAQVTLEHGSLEWVRLDKGRGFLDVPRARVSIAVAHASGGHVVNSGFTQALTPQGDFVTAEMTIPMLSGPRNPITVTVMRDGEPVTGVLQLHFNPRPSIRANGRVYRDVTCSSVGLEIESSDIRDSEWAYVGCNVVTVASAEHRTTFLELFVLWDGAGETIEVGGVPTRPTSDSLWTIQAPPRPGEVELRSGDHKMVLHYFIPAYPHYISVGAGLGAYYDSYNLPPQFQSFRGVEPLLTVYGSLALGSGANSRIAAFDATPIREAGYSDLGVYLQQKSTEFFDRRGVFTVFLGGHVLFYRYRGKVQIRPSAPQGGEILFRDVFSYGKNLTVGGLINPGLAGKYYFNGYLRWGSPRLFVEFNYIAWREHDQVNGDPIDLRSAGVSIGGPLFKAF